jgi:hypothetical protein
MIVATPPHAIKVLVHNTAHRLGLQLVAPSSHLMQSVAAASGLRSAGTACQSAAGQMPWVRQVPTAGATGTTRSPGFKWVTYQQVPKTST